MPRDFRVHVVGVPMMAPPAMAVPPPAMMAPPPPAMPPTAFVPVVFFNTVFGTVKMPDLKTKAIAAWVLWIVLHQLQSIFGPMRRQSRHWFIQYGAMAAFYLPTLIAFYTANAVHSSSSDLKIPLSIGCGFLLFLSSRGGVTMTAFTLHNGPQRLQSWRLLPWLLYIAWLVLGMFCEDRVMTTFSELCSSAAVLISPVIYVLLVKPKTPVLDCETKDFADYMVRKSRSSSSPFFHGDHPNRHGCKYPLIKKDSGWNNISDELQKQRRLQRDCAVDHDYK